MTDIREHRRRLEVAVRQMSEASGALELADTDSPVFTEALRKYVEASEHAALAHHQILLRSLERAKKSTTNPEKNHG